MNDELITWEESVRRELNTFIENFLSVSNDCTIGTKYFNPISAEFETHTEYDTSKINKAELRIVFNFEKPINKSDINFI